LSGKLQAKEALGKTAIVVGGGDAAFENALILSEFAKQVFLIHRRSEFSARPEFIEKVVAAARIDILTDSVVTGLEGKESLRTIKIHNPAKNETRRIAAEIMIIRIGVVPNTELLSETLAVDERGYVQIDSNCRTSVDSIYAVGDVANPHAPTISSAVGMGATAVKSISSKR
jgi:thioredoxin reductase (NADPH)